MVVYYLDTSAILKRYRTERGTEVVEALYGKLLKGKSLTEEAYDALLTAFAADLGDPLYAMPVTSRIINEAIEERASTPCGRRMRFTLPLAWPFSP